jgi:hypothetical protein
MVLALLVAGLAYFMLYRPYQLRWGASDAEIAMTIPGDELQTQPIFNATRAITIKAPQEKVWPWLVQMGYKRAGWYGLDLLDNAGIPSARQIVPELQQLAVGDPFPIFQGIDIPVKEIERNHHLLLSSDTRNPSPFVWLLYPTNQGQTRLVWRIRNAPYDWTKTHILQQLLTDAVDYVAVSEIMLGIKERVEATPPVPLWQQYTQIGLWFLAFLGFIIAEIGTVTWASWFRPFLLSIVTAVLTIAMVLMRPPLLVDAAIVILFSIGIWWAHAEYD